MAAGRAAGGGTVARASSVGRISLETAATTIGISEQELRAALVEGQTLAEVATANGVEPQAVIDALVAEATTRLDEAVADGDLEQADADERLAELTERITTAVNEGLPAKGGSGGRGGPHRPEPTTHDDQAPATEAPTTTDGGS